MSAVVAWVMATKVRLGKWEEARSIARSFDDVIARDRFLQMSISTAHARTAGSLVSRHGDLIDRMLAAQAQIEGIPLVSADPVFTAFGTRVIR